ncbi:MAG: HEPN domain-containing protein [Chitinispirillaceae bacterium]|nr:HEPN domain-containing protein [Chitinispirillaceae bacterium]
MIDFGEYLKNGLIKQQRADFRQIGKQIKRAEKDLLIFMLVLEKDPEWAATIAYHAMLRAGRALLFAHGYLPADGRQHKTVVEITGKILGEQYNLVVVQFEKLRKRRNEFFYDSMDTGNVAEAKKAAETAGQFVRAIKEKISQCHTE